MNKPLTLIIFGSTGDLYRNKLSVALFDLFKGGLLPEDFSIIGFSRRDFDDNAFMEFTKENLLFKKGKELESDINIFLKHFKYTKGDLGNLEDFKNLNKKLAQDDEERGICTNKLFYLSVRPSFYETILNNIYKAGLAIPCVHDSLKREEAWTRVLVEKPFGKNLEEAKKLDLLLCELFDESQIYRNDHYLAKETLQNILTFRFANNVFESLWNKEHISKIKIISNEINELKDRGEFYDGLGALRDVGQNHMLQMLALVTMENPIEMTSENIHKARTGLLEKVQLINEDKIIRAQYEGYLNELKVDPKSETETFFRIFLGVKNERWDEVVFELESGKALHSAGVSIQVYFKENKNNFCSKENPCEHGNVLTFFIQPNDGISFKFWIKEPGFDFKLIEKDLSFIYSRDNIESKVHDAYERVLYDCIRGDQTLFANTKEIMAEWNLITFIINLWQKYPLKIYQQGSIVEDIK